MECKQPFKAKVPDLYYGKLHMDCYHFCQKCKDHIEISWAIETNWTPFVASFFCENIIVWWTKFKHCRDKKVAPITWTEFKAFLQKNLWKSKLFVNSIWNKNKKDSQYQLEEIYDWALYLKYFQSIFIKFDLIATLTKSSMVRYFEKSLKPSIKVEIDQDAFYLDDYKELVAKTVRFKAKMGL